MSLRVVLITGATSGIGQACARRFAKEKCHLILVGRRKDRLNQLQTALSGVKTHVLSLDVRDKELVFERFSTLPENFREVDVLINNAGLGLGLQSFDTLDIEDIDRMVDTNIKGLLYCTRAILPGMKSRNRGHIVNLGSIAGTYPYPGGNVYGATKAFVHQFSLNLKSDLLGTAVKVTCVEPGMTQTEFSYVRFKGDKNLADKVYAGMHPLTSEDVSEIIFYLTTLPEHVNLNTLELMPVQQGFSHFSTSRQT